MSDLSASLAPSGFSGWAYLGGQGLLKLIGVQLTSLPDGWIYRA